jgi:nitrogen regulatory protein PII
MKRIDAIIRPNKLDDVKASLVALGVSGITAVGSVVVSLKTRGESQAHRPGQAR